jgi:ligand-binding sensor protein
MDYQFTDLVDIEAFRSMLKAFYGATGIMHRLVDTDNKIISEVGWQEVCADFHRAYPICNERCRQSNQDLTEQLAKKISNTFIGGMCRNGLMDYACPIFIEGKLMATLYFGQILHQPPDMDFFRRQARECQFDEESYLEAIRKVPVIARERVEPIMAFFSQLAQILGRS